MDEYERLVGQAVAEMRSFSEEGIKRAFAALSPIPFDDLLAEFSLWISELTSGRDVNRLVAEAQLPLPKDPARLVAIVDRNDLQGLHDYVGGDVAKLVASMLMLIASFQEVVERIG